MNDDAKSKLRSKKYHKRSPIACDECKLRKKKCDGGHPCGSCTLYQKDCTYESKTRPSQKPTVRIRDLEDTLRSVRNLLGQIKPDLSGKSLDDVNCMLDFLKPAAEETTASPRPATEHGALQSMLAGNGVLLKSGNRTFFHGPYSGPAMICSILNLFHGTNADAIHVQLIELVDSDERVVLHDYPSWHGHAAYLPERSEAASLFGIVMAQSHPFLQFLDPGLGLGLSDILEFSYGNTNLPEIRDGPGSMALCHIVLALGYLLDHTNHHDHKCETAFSNAIHHFSNSRQILQISEIDNLIRLQAIICTIVFLILTSRVSIAYSYISVASTSAIKQGLHIQTRTHEPTLDPVKPIQRQVLTTLINIDLYVSTVLGLPPMINIDTAGTTLELTRKSANQPSKSQEYFGEHIRNNFQSIAGDLASKYCQLVSLTASIMWDFSAASSDSSSLSSPTSSANSSQLRVASSIDPETLLHAERDLRKWTSSIGIALSPGSIPPSSSATPKITSSPNSTSNTATTATTPATDDPDMLSRVQAAKSHLELSFYHSQLLLYLPFLHYLQPLKSSSPRNPMPESRSRPALTCLKVAVNAIVRSEALLNPTANYSPSIHSHTNPHAISNVTASIMHPANFTVVYTIFLSVVSLIFLISIHDGTSKPGEAWRHADRGIRLLASLRCHRYAPANRCLNVVKEIVRQLNYTVDFDIEGIERTTVPVCERRQRSGNIRSMPGSAAETPQVWQEQTMGLVSRPGSRLGGADGQWQGPVGMGIGTSMSTADAMLAQAQEMVLTGDLPVTAPVNDQGQPGNDDE